MATRVLRQAALALALALAALSCRGASSAPPNVVMVVVDTLRADRVGCYGDAAALTPFLDGLAARGLRVEHAYAPSSWTMPSIATLFTSRYPTQHNVNDLEMKLADAEVTLAERLTEAGYASGGFTANWRLRDNNGFAQGFGRWQPLFPDDPKVRAKARGDMVLASSTKWLDEVHDESRPLFLYLHYFEPHAPMEPPADLRARFAPGFADAEIQKANALTVGLSPLVSKGLDAQQAAMLASLYRAEVASVDRELAAMFAELERRGLLGNAIVIVTADHGEEFLEHGASGHGTNLFNETVRVPLILAGPSVRTGVLDEPVSLIDLAPTILEMAGIAAEPRFEGRSRAALLAAAPTAASPAAAAASREAAADRTIVLQLAKDNGKQDLRSHEFGVVDGSRKLLVTPAGEPSLFDLAADPGERAAIDSPSARAALADTLRARMEYLATRRGPRAERTPVDAATLEKLRALGYHQ